MLLTNSKKHCTMLISTATLYLILCFNNAAAQDIPLKEAVRIGVLYWSMNIPGQVAMRKGLEYEAEQINIQASTSEQPRLELLTRVAGDGQDGIERQIFQMHELIKLKPDAIIVQPTDNAALAEPLREANRLNIPVIAYDQYISGGKLASFITSDNIQAGYLNGEYIASRFLNTQKIKLVLVEYPHVSSTVERLNGFLDALRDHNQPYEILNTYKAVQPKEGHQAGLDILKDFPVPGSIDVVFTVNDGGGLSVVELLAKAERNEIIVASIDGDPASIDNIRSGRLTHIDSAQFCGPLGGAAMRAGYSVATGLAVENHILVPVFPITKETLHLYPGWLGPLPLSFRKPWAANEPIWKGRVEASK